MKTYHKADCKRVFNRYDPTCPRCQELSNGALPRKGWNGFRKSDSFPRPKLTDIYCFCASTPLSVSVCPKCGKHPYTD